MLRTDGDGHLHPDSLVNAKTHHMTALAECHRWFGGSAMTKHVNGIIISYRDAVILEIEPPDLLSPATE